MPTATGAVRLNTDTMHYALLLHNSEPGEEDLPVERLREMEKLFDDYGKALHEAGVLVGGEILHFSPTATTLTRRSGTTEIQDGPFAESKEGLAGVFIVDVADAARRRGCPGRRPGKCAAPGRSAEFRRTCTPR